MSAKTGSVRRAPQAAFLCMALALTMFAGCVGNDAESSELSAQARQLKGRAPVQAVYPGQYRFDARYSQVIVEGTYGVLPKEVNYAKSKIDGADIQIVTWRPDTPEHIKVPVIIQASPYYLDTTMLDTSIGTFILDNFVPHGYAYTQLAIRSTGDSGGCDDFRGPKMTADMSQAIDWLAEQSWSSGNVTLIGISYIGTTPWYAAGSGNPHIKTIVPISGSTNPWEVYNRNGSAESRSAGIVGTYALLPMASPGRATDKKALALACAETWQGTVIGAYGALTGDKDPFRDWWEARNARPHVEKNYKGSILVVHGFEDWNVDPAVVFPWSRELNVTHGMPLKILVGQWGHTYPDSPAQPPMKRWDWAEILLHWWDYWLKGVRTDLGPAVQLQDNQGRWRNEEIYPPRDAQWKTLHLGAGGRLLEAPGASGSVRVAPTTMPLADQSRAAPAPIVTHADFRWAPAEKELLISGLPRIHVTVTPDLPYGSIHAQLLTINPATGAERRIGWTDMNLKYADGTDRPKTVEAGRPLLAMMEIQPMDAVVPAGQVLALRLWIAPQTERVPSVPPSTININWGGSTQSIVELPLIERPASAYFEPPRP